MLEEIFWNVGFFLAGMSFLYWWRHGRLGWLKALPPWLRRQSEQKPKLTDLSGTEYHHLHERVGIRSMDCNKCAARPPSYLPKTLRELSQSLTGRSSKPPASSTVRANSTDSPKGRQENEG